MDFSIESALRFGWETFKRRPWLFVGATIILFVAGGVVDGIVGAVSVELRGAADEPTLVGGAIRLLLGALIGTGFTWFYLRAHDDVETVSIADLWHPQPYWSYLLASVLVSLIVGIGFVLLIVPGVIASLMLMFTAILVIDRGLGAIDAMKESRRITYGHKWSLLGLVLVLILINIVGIIALLVGLLVTVPVSMLAVTHAYRVLSGQPVLRPADATLAI